jgi:chromosome partitioning protein
MGRIITLSSSKGGVGKTVLACCLAPGLARRGWRVGVVDADPNASFVEWHRSYAGPAIRVAAEARDVPVVDLAQEWADELDAVIVDTAGFGNLTAAAAMGAADWVLVPCMADRGSTREAARTVEKTASLARAARRAITASVVLSQWRPDGVAERAALDDLADYGVTSILRTSMPERTALRQMSFDSRALASGPLRSTVDALIDELAELGVLARPAAVAGKGKGA